MQRAQKKIKDQSKEKAIVHINSLPIFGKKSIFPKIKKNPAPSVVIAPPLNNNIKKKVYIKPRIEIPIFSKLL